MADGTLQVYETAREVERRVDAEDPSVRPQSHFHHGEKELTATNHPSLAVVSLQQGRVGVDEQDMAGDPCCPAIHTSLSFSPPSFIHSDGESVLQGVLYP